MFWKMLSVATCGVFGRCFAVDPRQAQAEPYAPGAEVSRAYAGITARPEVQQALEFIKADQDQTIADQRELCEIPAPPFMEQARGRQYRKRLAELGLKDVQTDAEGNVFGLKPGTGKGPVLLVCAHRDSVFAAGTDVTVQEKDGKLHAPGIADNARGLAAMLSIIRAFAASGVRTVGDVIFCANVGEEGLGDLRGVKAMFANRKDIDGFIAIDGVDAGQITYQATGSRRYEVTYTAQGGHSFGAFGRPSAIHAMGRAIARVADLQTPKEPKTTFTVGLVSGGTSVNAIAAQAVMLMDMRSDSLAELQALEARFLEIVTRAAAEENARWGSQAVTVETRLVGDRPAASQPRDAVIVQAAWASIAACGSRPQLMGGKSTDSNVPMSLGVPSVTLGGGGRQDNNHSPSEWFDPTDAYQGPQQAFMAILGLVGLEGVSAPLLAKR